jgi:transposase
VIASLPLSPHAAYRRNELQRMYVQFDTEIEKLNQRVEQQARERSGTRLLMTHPGVGPITALATEVFLGDPARFANSKELASYVGMIPGEYRSVFDPTNEHRKKLLQPPDDQLASDEEHSKNDFVVQGQPIR